MAYKAASLALFLAWCVCAAAQEQTGKIVFYRESHFRNYDYKPPIFCDGIELSRLTNGSFLEVVAQPGRHTCVAESNQGAATTIDIVPGDVAYLRMDITPTVKRHAFLITTTEAEYKQQKKLTLIATTHLNSVQLANPATHTPLDPPTGNAVQEGELDRLPQPLDVTQLPMDHVGGSAKFGDLVVTTTNMETRVATYSQDRREVSVFITVNNTGTRAICASFNAKLKTTFGFEYLGITSQGPSMNEMLPDEKAKGSYIFNVKEGVEPLELILELYGGTIRCKNSVDAGQHDVSIPNEIRLDVHDLPGLDVNDPRSKDVFRGDVGAVSHPSCIYCPDPKYTAKARAAKLQGTVQLKVVVGPDGNATDIEIVKGIGQGLDEEAVKAVQAWRFRPAIGPNGEPIETVVSIEVTFRLLK